jgi:hypothetical protein
VDIIPPDNRQQIKVASNTLHWNALGRSDSTWVGSYPSPHLIGAPFVCQQVNIVDLMLTSDKRIQSQLSEAVRQDAF